MKLIALLFCFLPFSVFAIEHGDATVVEVTSIYDADTFRVNLEGLPPIVGQHVYLCEY